MKKSILFILFSLFVSTLSAQNTTSYYCDFEDATENAKWHLNYSPNPNMDMGASSKNHWYFGAAGSFGMGSTQGLYIADTTKPTVCGYTATDFSGFQVAYRDMTLAAGTYNIQFDWKALGQVNDELIVLWVPASQPIGSAWNTTDQPLPTSWSGWNNAIHLRGKAVWQSYTGTLNVASAGGKLVILWANKKGTASNPAGAIDNIRIYKGTSCSAPSNVVYDSKSSSLTWNGNGSNFDVLLYNCNSNSFAEYAGLSNKSLTFSELSEEGMYYFYVRTNCGDSLHTSGWSYASKFVWIPGLRCIDFLDITPDNSGVAKCFSGSYSGGNQGNLKQNSGAIDFGYESSNSLHTIHYMPGETDPRTGNQLRTIPDGEVASIRINGLWESTHNQTATVEYDFTPKSGTSDLLVLKYACVLEAEGHPNPNDQPRFKLEVLDRRGNPIDVCSQADFQAGFTTTGKWHRFDIMTSSGYVDRHIDWCEWDSVTVSLRSHIGKQLTIRLTAYTCSQTVHLGYAYFTINCKGGDLQGISCGDYSTDHFDAPEGFNYRWYWEGDPNTTLGTEAHFGISPTTDSIYVVEVISKTKSGCSYLLTANPNPRYPRADFAIADSIPTNCQNRVKIKNDGKVYFINRKTGEEMATQEVSAVEDMVWNWGDGSPVESNTDEYVYHTFPDEGGTFVITADASMSNGICVDTRTYTITLPNIHSSMEAENIDLCRAETPTYTLPDGKIMDHDTTFLTYPKNKYGCDVEQAHHLFFHDNSLSVKDTTFCEGGYIDFEGKKYTETGSYKVPFKTVYGCDSTMQLNLTVVPTLQIDVDPVFTVCGDGTLDIPFDIIKGRYNGMKVHIGDTVYQFDANDPISIPMYDESRDMYLRPDLYDVTLELGTPDCPAEPVHVKADVKYASFIMYQKHGFIGLYNADFNTYGFEFDKKYTWYCNDELMPNDTLAYIRVKDSDWGKKYRVEVTRLDDGKKLISCPLTYTYGMPQGVEDLVADEEVVAYFDILGRRYATLPKQRGVYVVVYSKHSEKVVVE